MNAQASLSRQTMGNNGCGKAAVLALTAPIRNGRMTSCGGGSVNAGSMMARLKASLKAIPFLVAAKRRLWSLFDGTGGTTELNMLHAFPLYMPCSSGSYKDRAALTAQAIGRVFPLLASLSLSVNDRLLQASAIAGFPKDDQERQAAHELKALLDRYGSDKASRHGYHHLYGAILKNRPQVSAILEIGLGTNNADVVSNMGSGGKPGASLRAFRDFCPNATVYGADVDKRILFEEERIRTFFVDQTQADSFARLDKRLPQAFDLVIDDGLHSPHANLETLRFGLQKLRPGGWAVIEDIGYNALPLWQTAAEILPARFRPHILDDGAALLFAVERLQ